MNITQSSNNISVYSTIVQPYDHLYDVLITIDQVIRYYGVIVHFIFIIILVFSKKLHSKTLVYLNHATITNSFYCVIVFGYTFGDHPSFQNEKINEILCYASEIIWAFAIYIRMYSILLIAVYRYLAVFKMSLYRKINRSYTNLIIPIFVVWAISIGFPLISKYSFNTTSSYIFCLDGFSDSFLNAILYFVFNYTFMIVIPSCSVFFIYIRIIRKLKSIDDKIKFKNNKKNLNNNENGNGNLTSYFDNSRPNQVSLKQEAENPITIEAIRTNLDIITVESSSQIKATTTISKEDRKYFDLYNFKHLRHANQFILMFSSLISTAFVHGLFSIRTLLPDYFVIFYYWRPVLRIYIIIAISFVPIISLYFHPLRKEFIKKFKKIF